MIDQASFWFGVVTGVVGFIALGLALGPIAFKVTASGDGMRFKDERGPEPRFECTRCGRSELEGRSKGCPQGPCPMAEIGWRDGAKVRFRRGRPGDWSNL